jgi:hypothetical protein
MRPAADTSCSGRICLQKTLDFQHLLAVGASCHVLSLFWRPAIPQRDGKAGQGWTLRRLEPMLFGRLLNVQLVDGAQSAHKILVTHFSLTSSLYGSNSIIRYLKNFVKSINIL